MGSSSPAWLAKDLAAQKHLGKYKRDPLMKVWCVVRIDTGPRGDRARLQQLRTDDRLVYRTLPCEKLEAEYADVPAPDKKALS